MATRKNYGKVGINKTTTFSPAKGLSNKRAKEFIESLDGKAAEAIETFNEDMNSNNRYTIKDAKKELAASNRERRRSGRAKTEDERQAQIGRIANLAIEKSNNVAGNAGDWKATRLTREDAKRLNRIARAGAEG